MSRKKVDVKKVVVSISLPQYQKNFIDNHPKFNLSKYVQLHLSDYIELTNDVERRIENE